ncbi:GAF domain-containing protein [Mesobaculum littorinae]|uniref:histidine kinase n=1 Tax=Mesobaculum littorinae TaxID=2486419 RepID=A0A438AI89_9RHOB|nr:HWE histidine kinase domain-containing protein [Mesobaculum littorinae]RVV98456.1 GAF domain-containing protein [Mesobaculum littorinae]
MTDQNEQAFTPPVDLTNCDREPIHILGKVQGFGCLIATSSDWMVQHVSANATDILGLDPETLIGTPLSEHLPAETLHHLRTRMQISGQNAGPARTFGLDVFEDGRLFDVSGHISGRSFVLEFEPKSARRDLHDLTMVQPLIARISEGEGIESICRRAARGLKALSGFDRVMVYKFNEDGSGTVLAEDRQPELGTFLGLRYPATDIPQQARELYKRNLIRLIADVNGEVSPIVPELSPEGAPVDLSLATTRAVSPIHLEYLRNMGVEASMSLSILHQGELWGLFACHHYSPRYIDYELRTAVELFGQLFSYELAQKTSDAERQHIRDAQNLHDRIVARLSHDAAFMDRFDELADEILQVIPADGFAVFSDDRYASRGIALDEPEFRRLARVLNTAISGQVLTVDNLSRIHPPAAEYADQVAGILAIPISRSPRDYIVLFRREVAQIVKWAGDPKKPAQVGPNGLRLTPRKSFEAWQELVRGHSTPWLEPERRAAETLRVTLLEVVLRLSEEANRERARAQEKQALLIAELNHRVRNILNLIRGIVKQSGEDAKSVEEFTSVLGGRIQSLAAAHDQLTQQSWGPTPLQHLIEVEAEAYAGGGEARVEITGQDVELNSSAFTTMALVIHEMMTNAAKYGALSLPDGRVEVRTALGETGGLEIEWREKGGPQVVPPERRGFGSTLIESSIPFELGGTAEVTYAETGIIARFTVPKRHLSIPARNGQVPVSRHAPALRAVGGGEAGQPEAPQGDPAPAAPLSNVLLLEDNMVIALDASDLLKEVGAEAVTTCGSVADAMAALDAATPDLGVLDLNLGSETSEAVAHRLVELGVPFVFATGYDSADDAVAAFPAVPLVRKPFSAAELKQALDTARRGRG